MDIKFMSPLNKNDLVLILGGSGLVGSALVRAFKAAHYTNIIAPSRRELDLLNSNEVSSYIIGKAPKIIIDAAAKVGGIHANNVYRADFILENLAIQNNLFKAALAAKVPNFIFLGSSCIYPKHCPQPILEEYLLTSELEPTNEPYAIAKIAGLKTAENIKRQYGLNYFSLMPTNLYGVGDNFHPENSHVIPGLIRRMDETIKAGSKIFKIWGTGRVKREFLYVDDLASACLFIAENKVDEHFFLNVGTGEDLEIGELAKKIGELMGFNGTYEFDTTKPDGTPRKVLDVSKIQKLGWKAKVSLHDGLVKTIDHFKTSAKLRVC
jgi:GDP-L-fucose synthase